jgi:NtrC-family two-component system sensor histidine kinase KinB
VIGRSLFELVPELNPSIFENVVSTGQPYERKADQIMLSKSITDSRIYWDWAAWPLKDSNGETTGLVATFADATDRVALQLQREDFVATLTHDLKTPVLATNRAVEFLLAGDFGSVSDSQKEILETMLQSNTALYKLVETLLDVYKFESGLKEFFRKNCSLMDLINQAVAQIMPLAQERGVVLLTILPDNEKLVSCDEDEIRRVLQNLIDNSVKFTRAGGTITITMKQDEATTTVSVADTGKGIPEETKPKLFQRFWQSGSSGSHYASTGLGLYLCRRIIEGHGGKIWFESTAGQGSTFYFQI